MLRPKTTHNFFILLIYRPFKEFHGDGALSGAALIGNYLIPPMDDTEEELSPPRCDSERPLRPN